MKIGMQVGLVYTMIHALTIGFRTFGASAYIYTALGALLGAMGF